LGAHLCGAVFGACVLVFLVLPASGVPAERDLTIGWEGDARRGILFGLTSWDVGTSRGRTLSVQAGGSMFYYRLFEESEEIRVNSTGGGIGLTVRMPLGTSEFAVGSAIELVRERTVFDFGEVLREWNLGPTFNLRFDVPIDSATFVALSFNFSQSSRYFWLRSALFKEAFEGRPEESGESLIGAEFTAQGNHDMRIYQIGPVFELEFPRAAMMLSLRGGYSLLRTSFDKDRPAGYFGGEISYFWSHGGP
jgi:hypothetical protein